MHTDPDILALLALGEPAGTDTDRAHIEACPDCAATLDAFTGAAAAGRSSSSVPTLVSPHGRVWEQVARAVAAEASVPERAAAPEGAAAPERAAAPESVGAPEHPVERPAVSVRPRSKRSRFPVRWLALAAALVLAATVGGVVTTLALQPRGDSTPGTGISVLARAALTALPAWPGASGDAVVESNGSETSMVVSVNAATDRPDTYREVWLLSADLTKLVSLGLLAGDSGTFAIPTDLDMSQYSIVDVSSEPLDGNPAHSSDSIVRGSFSS
ncbi:hypothetical protein B7R54_16265 [Subtercola boreus]|uniref:Anti-sigma K factor RskA C-terminal domain-containing protein n=1 Tax=Subtercola boreus TaxID=120213 RepID=A0A3E0VLR0_9MICO|nr:anti-sigma factor [Subtercola boreus]RFA10585.1 hypothetical protein B7R54_16265 [Subtercola boreus]TQL55868.1 anti-sigma-K factor rskA [Subtercola boreus]